MSPETEAPERDDDPYTPDRPMEPEPGQAPTEPSPDPDPDRERESPAGDPEESPAGG